MIEAGVALHARGDRQGRGMILRPPQDGGIERPLMQIVEGRVGGRGRHHLAAARDQGIGQGQKAMIGLARREDPQRRHVNHCRGQGGPARREGGLALDHLLPGDGGTHQMFQPQGGLHGVGRRRHDDVRPGRRRIAIARAHGHHRQASRQDGVVQGGDRGRHAGSARIDDGRLDRQVGQAGEGGGQGPGRDRGPAQGVEPLAQGPDQIVVRRDNQNTRIETQTLSPWPRSNNTEHASSEPRATIARAGARTQRRSGECRG